MAASRCSKLFFASPIIVILGATGTGKSKLAIQIAKRFRGEIISADAMQMYKGLDIATNKVTEKEQEGIPHHLLGFLNPMKFLNVCEFRDHALEIIEKILERKNLPIIVGGTNYYIESILYDYLIPVPGSTLDFDETEGSDEEESPRKKQKLEYEKLVTEMKKHDNETLHEKLREVDPETAERLHPNDRRKVLRSLCVFLHQGEKLSSLLEKQRSQPGGCDSGGPLRFSKSVILWIQCNPDVLTPRLDARVDGMIAQGLVNELLDFHKEYNKENLINNRNPDYTKGIFQSIGFKEFHEYLILDEDTRESEEGKKLREKGIELLKVATRQYAKQQGKWILNRLLRNSQRQVPPIYGLDGNDVSQWDEKVYKVAEDIVEKHLAGEKPSVDPVPIDNTRVVIDRTYKCEICDKILVGSVQWGQHIKGRKHEKMVKKKKRLENEEKAECQGT